MFYVASEGGCSGNLRVKGVEIAYSGNLYGNVRACNFTVRGEESNSVALV
jgi:cytoskeletal protein CcmA (bactofilin family)